MGKQVILFGPYPPPYGGVSIYVSALFEFLQGFDVKLWTYGDKELKDPKVSFMKDKRLGIIPLLITGGYRARIADCNHFLVEYPSILVPVWALLKPLLRFEWVKIIHDGTLPSRYSSFGTFRKLLFRLAARSVTRFIVVSEDLQHWLRHEIKVKQEVLLIKSLLPVPYRESNAPLPAEMENALSRYLRHHKRVCSIGVFIPSYGFKHVADAIERIRQETDEDIGLVLLDGAFADDEDYRSEVLQQRDWITVLRNVPHPSVLQILKRSDLFVRAFGMDSYGLSRVEAIWCGLPVVATKAGEVRGMLLYDYGDEKELIRQIKRALFSPPVQDVRAWAERFQREAEENLQALIKGLGLT